MSPSHNGHIIPCRAESSPLVTACPVEFYPSANFKGPDAHDAHFQSNYYLIRFPDGRMAAYSDADGARRGTGYGRKKGLTGLDRTIHRTSREIAQEAFKICHSSHVHLPEEHVQFETHPAAPSKGPGEYVRWTAPAPSGSARSPSKAAPAATLKAAPAAKVKSTPTATPKKATPKKATPKKATPKKVTPKKVTPKGTPKTAPASTRSSSRASSRSDRSLDRSSNHSSNHSSSASDDAVDELAGASSSPVRKLPGPDSGRRSEHAVSTGAVDAAGSPQTWTVLPNGEAYGDSKSAAAAIQKHGFSEFKVFDTLDAALEWGASQRLSASAR
ncbi:hypothetical protein B0H15DRAFT_806181 [Mycena belliarum]|uniref:Uncharacterized protein n=1 Tax=Mycena belliarum TaxID=1033014 RepID=A0AAD6XF86_9AGAR|nr:hypothetical protein B0H15DRAFT_806181 [Mycena belliae]